MFLITGRQDGEGNANVFQWKCLSFPMFLITGRQDGAGGVGDWKINIVFSMFLITGRQDGPGVGDGAANIFQ